MSTRQKFPNVSALAGASIALPIDQKAWKRGIAMPSGASSPPPISFMDQQTVMPNFGVPQYETTLASSA